MGHAEAVKKNGFPVSMGVHSEALTWTPVVNDVLGDAFPARGIPELGSVVNQNEGNGSEDVSEITLKVPTEGADAVADPRIGDLVSVLGKSFAVVDIPEQSLALGYSTCVCRASDLVDIRGEGFEK